MVVRPVRGAGAASGRRCRHIALAVATVLSMLLGLPANALADWMPVENLAGPTQVVLPGTEVAYDGAGTAYAVYVEYSASFNDHIYLREHPPAGPWGPPQLVPANTGSYVRDLTMDVNAAGDVVIAFRSWGTHVVRRPAGGSWSAVTSWSSPGFGGPTSGCPSEPALAVGDDGTAVVAWDAVTSCNGSVSRWKVLASAFTPGGGWEATPQLWAVSPQIVNSRPGVAVDDDGSITVAFNARNSAEVDQLWTVERGATWGSPVMRGALGINTYPPGVASRGGTTVVAWYAPHTTYAIVKTGGVWSAPDPLPGDALPTGGFGPAVGVDGSGTGYVARSLLDGETLEVKLTTIAPGGGTTEKKLSTDDVPSANPSIAVNTEGDVALVWDEFGTGNWVAVAMLRPTGTVWPAATTPITTVHSDNFTLARVAIDTVGHAVIGATPLVQGFADEVDVSIESRDVPITCPTAQDGAWIGSWAANDASATGGIDAQLSFAGDVLSGTMRFVSGSTTLNPTDTVTGTVTCDAVDGALGAMTISATLSADGTQLTGTYSGTSGDGTWRASRVEQSVSTTGTELTTDSGDTGATPANPLQVAIDSPNSGSLSITTADAGGASTSGYSLVGDVIHITAPDATAAAPLSFTFELDASLTGGAAPADVAVLRNGIVIDDCTGPAGEADPDPCVSDRVLLPGGNIQITALSSHASVWALGLSQAVSVGSGSVVEGDSGKARVLLLPVTLSSAPTAPVTVHYTIHTNGSATGGTSPKKVDFKNASGNVTFGAGATTTKYIKAAVFPDRNVEADETFDVVLSNPTGGYALAASLATATIVDDDPGGQVLRAGVGDVHVREGDGAAANPAKIQVNLSSPAPSSVSVTVTIANGTATAKHDYKRAFTKTLTFTTGQWQKSIVLPVLPDLVHETDETITVTLSNPSGVLALGRANGTITIDNDD